MAENKLELKVITSLQDKLSAPLKGIGGASLQAAKELEKLQGELKQLSAAQQNIERFRNLKTSIDASKSAFEAAQSRVKSLAQELSKTESPSRSLQMQFQKARNEASQLKDKLSTQSIELQKLRTNLSSAGISTKSLSQGEIALRQNIAKTNEALDKQQQKLNKVSEIREKIASKKEQLGKTQETYTRVSAVGYLGYQGGAKVLNDMVGVMKPGVEFSSSMSKVQSLTRLDSDSKELAELRQQARDLGASTMFSATEAADAQGFLAMAGFTPDAIKNAMPGMLDMAKAGGLELARAADISSNILSGMNLDSSQMGRVGDVLVGAFTRSNTNLEMLGETMKYAAPMAASLGVDIETLAAATGKLGDAGIQGSMAGTALRSILNRLSAPPKAAAEALDQLGIKTKDAKGNLRDFPTLLQELDKKTKNMGSAERAGFFKAIAGEEAVSALNVLVDKSSGELQELRDSLKGSDGEAAKVAKTMADNITGDLDELSSAWEDVGISIFDGQEGVLRSLIQTGTGVLNWIGSWIKENPILVRTIVAIVAVIAAFATAAGGLAIAFAGIMMPIATLSYVFSLLKAKAVLASTSMTTAFASIKTAVIGVGKFLLANPIILVIAAIAAAAYLIWKNWDYLKAKAIEIWTSIKQRFTEGWTYLTNLTNTIGSVLTAAFTAVWNGIVSFFTGIWTQLTTAASGGLAGIGALIVNWSPLGLFYQAFAGVLSWFGLDLPANLTGAISTIITNISSTISTWNISGVFQTVWSSVKSLFSGYATQFTEFGSNLISGLVSGIRNMAGAAKDAISNVGSSVVGWFKEKLGIRSPSRVFIGLGGFVTEGLAKGIDKTAGLAVKASKALATGTLAGAAALSSTALAAPVVEPANIKFDRRPGLMTQTQQQALTSPSAQSNTNNQNVTEQITINIYGGAMDPQAIAKAVKQELERRESDRRSKMRSRYTDYGA